MRVHIDIETFSTVDLPKTGVYRYAEDQSTEVLCIAYAVNDGKISLWAPGMSLEPLIALVNDPVSVLAAHNASFERIVLNGAAGKKIGFPATPISKWLCTAAKAAAHSLPRSLAGASSALGLIQKDDAGKRVMMKLSRPRKPTKDNSATRWTRQTAPEDFKILEAYCVNDVAVERAIDKTLPDLTADEAKVYSLDQEINDTGLQVDLPVAQKVITLAEIHKQTLEEECKHICGFTPGQRASVMTWCAMQGYSLTGYTALDIVRHLQDPKIPANVRRVLWIRAETSRTSVKKYEAMTRAATLDQRIKGMFLYHGAGTGRWAGRIVQLQNLPRGKFKDMNEVANDIAIGDLESLTAKYTSPMDAFSSAIRPMIKAPADHELITADFANIEGRVLAWLAGETWKLQAFEAFDRGEGPDLYLVSASRIYGCSIEEAKPHRQLGKIAELALGFGGGVGAFSKMASLYGFQVELALDSLSANCTPEMKDKAKWAYSKSSEPNKRAFLASDLIKQLWRSSHPATTAFWYALENGVKEAITTGNVVTVGKLKLAVRNDFLYMKLPSGRKLAYYKPEIRTTHTRIGNKEVITFMGENAVTGKFERDSTYSGKLAENAVQAVARDFLVQGMFSAQESGYKIIGHVHDEIITELPKGLKTVQDLEHTITSLPAWASGIPLAAEGWAGKRYRK